MPQTLYWNPSTLILPMGGNNLRLFQAYDRRNVLTNLDALPWINQLVGGCDAERARAAFEARASSMAWADATAFSLWDHAFANPDFFDRSVQLEDARPLSWDDAFELLSDARILLDSWPPPVDADKRHYGDRFRGSFYEQLATEALFQRTTPSAWWTAQKFTADHKAIRPTPYRYIEEHFLERYFREHLNGKDVLEIGCGTGYFTAKMARHARRVSGLDYNPDYVEIARRSWPESEYPNLRFQVGDITRLPGDRNLRAESFDAIVLIDTFLFLFDDRFQADLHANRSAIMQNLRKLLKPDGALLVMDPHPFWLTPWIGGPTNPVGVLTEYRRRRFKVIPTIEELTGFLCENGMRLRRVLEPGISEDYQGVDSQAHQFMTEIPQWWFLEIEAAVR